MNASLWRAAAEPADYEDDGPPSRMRCTRGHYLPKEPTGIYVDAGEEGRGPMALTALKTLPPDLNADVTPYWVCKCGAEAQEEI